MIPRTFFRSLKPLESLKRSLPGAVVISLSCVHLLAAGDTWTGAVTGADLNLGSNWSLGTVPTGADDAIFPTTPTATAVNLNAANLTFGSFNFLRVNGPLVVQNRTTTATDSTLTLGSAGHANIAAGASANDLLYVASSSTVTFNGTNGGGGTGVLKLALGRSGDFNIVGSAVITSSISGAYGINKTGAGTLTLGNAANSFSGGLVIKAGTVTATSSGTNATNTTFGSGTVTLGDSANTGTAATLNLNHLATITYANNIATTGTGVNTINVQNYYSSFTGGIALGSNLVLSTSNPNNSTLSFSGAFTGTGNLTTALGGTNGGSSIVLSNSVNMVGTITNNGSVLPAIGLATVNITGAIGSNVTTVTQNSVGSQLSLGNTGNAFTGGIFIKAGTLSLAGNAGVQGVTTNAITLGDAANTGLATTLNATASGTYVNPISVVGNGVHSLSVTGNNPTFSGAITLNSNNLNLVSNNNSNSNLNVTGGITGTGNINLQVLGTNNASRVTVATTSINNTGTITNNGSGIGTAYLNSVIGTNVTGVIQDSLTSPLVLANGANTFTSGILVKAGTLSFNGTSAGNAGTGAIVVGDSANTGKAATLNFNNSAFLTYANAVGTAGNGVNTVNVANYNAILTGGLTLGGNVVLSVTNTNVPIGSTLAISSAISGSGNLSTQLATGTAVSSRINLTAAVNHSGSFTNEGAGAGITTVSGNIGSNVTGVTQNSATSPLILSGTNTYSGTTTISAGTLTATGGNAIPNSGAVSIASGGVLALTSGETIGSLSGVSGSSVTLGANTLTTGSSASSNFAGVISGTGAVVTQGTGKTTLSGTNTYTGATTVGNGSTLAVNGSTSTGNVTVASGGTLTGSGTVGGATTVNGTHAAGDGIGNQTFSGNLTYASGSTFSWQLGDETPAANFDTVDVGGALNISGTGTTFNVIVTGLDIAGNFWMNDRSWDIFDSASAAAGTFANFVLYDSAALSAPVSYAGYGDFSFSPVTGVLSWNSAVPEPTNALAGLLIGAGLLRRRRSSKR